MKTMFVRWLVGIVLAVPGLAQATGGGTPPAGKAAAEPAVRRVVMSDAGRQALAGAKELAAMGRGLRGPERLQALEKAASAHDKLVAEFAGEPVVAAAAAFAAAELWRQQGSLPLAEQDFLTAARLDGERYAQRGLLGAADMQRRQKRYDDAMATYQKAAAVDPGSARAQEARLWQARLLQGSERLDEAIVAFQACLESAAPGAQVIETCNFLALAWVQKGDFDAAERAIEHAEQAVAGLGDDEDPIVLERLRKSLESMSARKALQRARDKQAEAGKDAVGFDRERSGG
jgi:tetratricopeptide (TPR) repeat protein